MKKILVVSLLFASLAMMVAPSRSSAALDDASVQALKAQIAALLAQIQQLQTQIQAMQGGGSSGGSDVVNPKSNPYTPPFSGDYAGGTKSALGLTAGDRVVAKEAVRVRSGANGAAVVTSPVGAKGTVASKSIWKDGYWWAEIYWDNRVRGFSAEDFLAEVSMTTTGICGDLNGDGLVNVQDTIWMMLYNSQGAPIPNGVNADMDGNGTVADVIDKMMLDNYVLRGGAQPSCVPPQSIPVQPPAGSQPKINAVPQVFVPDYSMCGDVNGDGGLNIFDTDLISGAAFQNQPLPVGAKGDLNADGVIDILDVTIMVNHVNRGYAAPSCTKPNNAPKITGLPTLPSRIEAGQSVGLSWTATDVEKDSLQWNVMWGDGGVSSCSANCGNQYSGSHTWVQVGSYTIEAKVYDGKAWSQPHSFTIEVLPKTITPVTSSPVLICGDIDLNGTINDADSVLMSDYVFGGVPIPDMRIVDLNGDGYPDIIDVTLLINKLRNRTPLPTCPLLNVSGPRSGSAGT